MPERNQTEASPAALLVESRTPQKSFLFLLEEKIGRAQIRKSEENFFVGQCRFPARRRGGFLSSVQSGFAQSLEYPTDIEQSIWKNKNAPQMGCFYIVGNRQNW
ncbi:MAG TPA: hypothetical protein PK539_04085 [Candidatus Paceibacterota bacterium]|nr:hypothetical protein [Candidatus Paceibacterota bacterium]